MGIAIIGAGGFARHILPYVRPVDPDIVLASEVRAEIATTMAGFTVLDTADLAAPEHAGRSLCLAIGSSAARRRIHAQMKAQGRVFADIRASTAIVYDDAEIGEGLVLCHFSMIMANTRVGRQFQCNYYSSVAHDCVIGDFVTFAPRVACNGHVVVEDGAFVGAGAIIRDGRAGAPIVIGAGAVVGMGAVVTRSVPPGATVAGNPARILPR